MSSLYNNLSSWIHNAEVPVKFPEHENRTFVPSDIVRLVNETSLSGLLSNQSGYIQSPQQPDKALFNFILQWARRIFIICIYTGYQDLRGVMQCCMDNNITDRKLPLSARDVEKMWPYQNGRQRHFLADQLIFAPTLPTTTRTARIKMHATEVFPFTSITKISEGNFGLVWRVTIHESYQDPKVHVGQVRHFQSRGLLHL